MQKESLITALQTLQKQLGLVQSYLSTYGGLKKSKFTINSIHLLQLETASDILQKYINYFETKKAFVGTDLEKPFFNILVYYLDILEVDYPIPEFNNLVEQNIVYQLNESVRAQVKFFFELNETTTEIYIDNGPFWEKYTLN